MLSHNNNTSNVNKQVELLNKQRGDNNYNRTIDRYLNFIFQPSNTVHAQFHTDIQTMNTDLKIHKKLIK